MLNPSERPHHQPDPEEASLPTPISKEFKALTGRAALAMSGDFVSYFLPNVNFRRSRRGGSVKAPEYNEDEQKKLLEEFPPDILMLAEAVGVTTGRKIHINDK